MRKRRVWRNLKLMLLTVALLSGAGTGTVFAVNSSSNNYQLSESEFTTGTSLNSCSGAYCSQTSTGNIGGSGEFGNVNSDEPVLEVIVESGASNLGVLSTQTTATKTTVVKVRSFESGGYLLQIMGDPPKYNGHPLNSLIEPTASLPGTEQFGINLVANTTPSVGADPVQLPKVETTFGPMKYGTAAVGYDTPNLFKYVSGDVVARSLTDSGRTDYTISMILNISNETPAGVYSGDFSAIVMPAY